MRFTLVTAILASSLCACAQQDRVPSVGTTADAGSLVRVTDGGEFVEVERTAEYSLVEVRSAPKGSVPSSMFALRGACAVARARGEQYVSSVPVPGSVPKHRLSFPKSATETQLKGQSKSVFSLAECEMLRF